MTIQQHLENLVRMRTTHAAEDREVFGEAIEYVRGHIPASMEVEVVEVEGYPNLVARTMGKQSALVLACHLDVVAAEASQFAPAVKDGRLYGRGASDMKFAAAVYLAVLERLGKKLEDLSLTVFFTTDEEIGGHRGTNYLLGASGYGAEAAFLPDGGDNWQVELAAKGFHFLRLTARGKYAHGSRPWLGKNAITTLVNCIHTIESVFPRPLSERDWIDTINVGTIEGGISTNSVPESASATLDVRYAEPEHRSRVFGQIQTICDLHEVEMEVVLDEPPHFEKSMSEPHIKTWVELARSQAKRVTTLRSTGGSDARFFTEHGIPCLVTKPIAGDHHTETEWVDVADLEVFARVLEEYIVRMAR